jgi:probable DNA repair protein
VTGVDEARWPPPATPDAFIPVSLQVQASMHAATASLARERARKLFERLRCIAPGVVLSWGRKDQDVEVLPSPWLRETGAIQEVQFRDQTYAASVFTCAPTLEVAEESTAPAIDQAHVRGGTRIFELQSQCPFRAFAELRLGARPLDEVAPSVDARERGTLVHAAFAEVWSILRGSTGLRAKSADELEVLVRTSLARHVAKLQEGASAHRVRMLQIETEIAAERMLALLQLDRERKAFNVVGRPETQETAHIGKLKFELRLDRMDELLDDAHRGERVIVDYKTGNNVQASSWTSERPEQPQLPLYAVTHPDKLAAVSFVTVGAKGVGYQGVARDNDILPGVKEFSSKKLGLGDWRELLTHWQRVVETLADEFASGHATVDPLPSACRYCHLNTICRVREQTEVDLRLANEEGEA